MGFTTGFLGGVTLTYSLLYFSLYVHRANRSVQRSLLSQQATLLNSAVEPPPPLPEPPAYEVRRAGLVEELKDRWNSEIERLVRRLQNTDWAEKRALLEEQTTVAWTKVKSSDSAHELEAKAKQLEQKVKDTITDGAGNVKDAVARKTENAAAAAEDTVKGHVGKEPRLLELK